VLEVKRDFCRKVKGILDRHGRAEDFVEISLDSDYRYNPLHNDLDAYALAFKLFAIETHSYVHVVFQCRARGSVGMRLVPRAISCKTCGTSRCARTRGFFLKEQG
jgi:hypothetical protein